MYICTSISLSLSLSLYLYLYLSTCLTFSLSLSLLLSSSLTNFFLVFLVTHVAAVYQATHGGDELVPGGVDEMPPASPGAGPVQNQHRHVPQQKRGT